MVKTITGLKMENGSISWKSWATVASVVSASFLAGMVLKGWLDNEAVRVHEAIIGHPVMVERQSRFETQMNRRLDTFEKNQNENNAVLREILSRLSK